MQLSFDYKLEPFGSMVFYLPPGATDASQGEWLPKPAPVIHHLENLPAPVVITEADTAPESQPLKWERLQAGASVESLGRVPKHSARTARCSRTLRAFVTGGAGYQPAGSRPC